MTIRHRIGMVFQRPNPFPKTIFENVVYGPRIHGERDAGQLMEICERSLRRAALWDEVKDRLDRSALDLSGGQQQRLCIARCSRRRSRSDSDGRAGVGARSDRYEQDRRPDRRAQKRVTVVIVTHSMQQAARISDYTAFFCSAS